MLKLLETRILVRAPRDVHETLQAETKALNMTHKTEVYVSLLEAGHEPWDDAKMETFQPAVDGNCAFEKKVALSHDLNKLKLTVLHITVITYQQRQPLQKQDAELLRYYIWNSF